MFIDVKDDPMNDRYEESVVLLKALADSTRLMIVDMLSCGELCACMILGKFNITQPTLSHHMKILCDSGLVNGRKDGRWTYYSLNSKAIETLSSFVHEVTMRKEACICKEATPTASCCLTPRETRKEG
jgi:ArsR family transcriptional regulator